MAGRAKKTLGMAGASLSEPRAVPLARSDFDSNSRNSAPALISLELLGGGALSSAPTAKRGAEPSPLPSDSGSDSVSRNSSLVSQIPFDSDSGNLPPQGAEPSPLRGGTRGAEPSPLPSESSSGSGAPSEPSAVPARSDSSGSEDSSPKKAGEKRLIMTLLM